MFKKIIQKIFKPYSWRLIQEGYNQSDRYAINFKKYNNNEYIEEKSDDNKYFERSLSNELQEYIIIGRNKVKHLLIFKSFLIHSKDYRMNNKYNLKGRFDYVNQVFPKINKISKNYLKMTTEFNNHILLIAKHISEYLPLHPFLKGKENSNLSIKKKENIKDTYTIVDNIGLYRLEHKNHAFENEVKIIGDYLYNKRKTSNNFQMISECLTFAPVNFFELSSTSDIFHSRDCVIEISFNDINFYYMTIRDIQENRKKNQEITIFKNKRNEEMMSVPSYVIMAEKDSFDVIYHSKSSSDYYVWNGRTMFTELAINDEKFRKWLMTELHKTCISKESREAFGFRLKGELDKNELMVIEAMFI